MKILCFVSSLAGGGAERVLSTLCNRWSEKHSIVLATLKCNEDFYPISEQVTRVKLNNRRSTWYDPIAIIGTILSIRRLIKESKPDYIVSFVLKTNLFVLLAKLGLRYPVIVCEHSIISRDDIDPRQAFLRRLMYPLATRVTVLTESIKQELLITHKNLRASRVIVVPNPIELNINALQKTSIKNARQERRQFNIVSLGRLIEIKNFESMINGFALYHESNPDARLDIYGEGPKRDDLLAIIRAKNLESNIVIHGNTNDVTSVLFASDVFAITSKFEGMPMALLESMLVGIPSVGYDSPGVRDFIADGNNGFLLRFNDTEAFAQKLDFLANHPAEHERMGIAATKTAQRYTPDKIDDIWFEKVLTND